MSLWNKFLIVALALAGGSKVVAGTPTTADHPTPAAAAIETNLADTQVAVVISGGHDTDPRDRGRPVILVASALGVPPEVFRRAFSHVRPAPAGEAPEPAQVQLNKAALLDRLSPYGVSNEWLDEVSDYYRYVQRRGELWRHVPAKAYATIRNGNVTGFVITNPGSGYTSPPKISVPGMPGVHATAILSFGTDFRQNGSISEIKLAQ